VNNLRASEMALRLAWAFITVCSFEAASAQSALTYKAAVVALTDDTTLRAEFERGLVAKAVGHDYDAVTSYDLVPNVSDRRLLRRLAAEGVRAVLMLRPAAIGEGSSLESVRAEVSPVTFASMRDFSRRVSPSGATDLIAVVHMAAYAITDEGAELISSGAVWLDEPVIDRAEGIARLQDLVVATVDAARPAIRQRLGLPPL
jgi:hypothetical protein